MHPSEIKPLSDLIPESIPSSAPVKKKKEAAVRPIDLHINDTDDYQCPPVDLLDPVPQTKKLGPTEKEMAEMSNLLQNVLEEFGIRGEIDQVRPGPVVTLFEFKPAPGIKTSRVISLADDIARSMSALSARIAVIPGQNAIGIELPNQKRATVFMRELLLSQEYMSTKCALPIILGKNIGGEPVIADLTRMPHLLVAGTTGSGKSVSVNAMILSLLFKYSPDQCRFIMVDPKMLELSIYDDIPHLLTPVVTDPKKAVVALKWAVKEMENRYHAMSKLGVRNIEGYNTKIREAKQSGELLSRRVQTGFDPDSGKPIFETQNFNFEHLPFIVVIVDEMADLMLVAGKEIESAVQRLAQMARAAGIHLIMATQRPSVDVITGTIKANFPTRVSFMVTSKIDSRTILGEQGAEQLLGQGDMLYMAGGGRTQRVHGPYMKDAEVESVVAFLKTQGEPSYIEQVTQDIPDMGSADVDDDNKRDPVYEQAVNLIRLEGKVSTSFIQRHLSIGYNRAARIVDQMEAEGIVSPPNHTGKREILG
ncbi:MAG: DNA translocase FtsK [Alphaproteobacteria bacterium]|nr:DNA translocase FtsK [Alphaproteobacteria bacterium]